MILGVERECRRRVRAACGWLRLGRVSRRGDSLLSAELRKELMESGEPRGRPSRVVPFSHGEKGMCLSGSGKDGDDGEERMHFSELTFRSVGWSCSRRCWKACATSIGGPKMFPSSRYQEWKEWGATEGRDEMMGCIPRAKRMGERGSPCCTPVWDWMMPWEWKRRAGVEWVKKNQGASCGMDVYREDRMEWREMVLKAFDRSTCKRR